MLYLKIKNWSSLRIVIRLREYTERQNIPVPALTVQFCMSIVFGTKSGTNKATVKNFGSKEWKHAECEF
jgi:hypothetical protein